MVEKKVMSRGKCTIAIEKAIDHRAIAPAITRA
jgi:hypothetical protein